MVASRERMWDGVEGEGSRCSRTLARRFRHGSQPEEGLPRYTMWIESG